MVVLVKLWVRVRRQRRMCLLLRRRLRVGLVRLRIGCLLRRNAFVLRIRLGWKLLRVEHFRMRRVLCVPVLRCRGVGVVVVALVRSGCCKVKCWVGWRSKLMLMSLLVRRLLLV